MALEVTYRHGNPLFVDYTPGGAVNAGQVVVVGELPCVAHAAIEANKLGALAAAGGVYKCTGDGALTAGAVVYWNDTTNKVTATSAGNKKFGFIAPGSSISGDGATGDVVHRPGA